MVGGIWGQTRSYGDTYHWAFHDGTVESLSAVSVFFPGGRKPGAGDEVAGDISQPGGAELSDQRAQALRLWASDKFGSGCAGLGNMGAKNMTRTLEISVWDLRYPGNLTGLKGRVCLCGRCDFRTNASHVWRRTSALHTMVLGAR
jgi:hypothetical protein